MIRVLPLRSLLPTCVLVTRIVALMSGVVCALWSHPAHAGKLGDLREETGASSSDSSSGSDSDSSSDDDDCSFLAALLTDCDTARDTTPATPVTFSSEIVDPEVAARKVLGRGWFFPSYPYRGESPGNMVRRSYPYGLVPSGCSPGDSPCHRAEHVVTCVDATCYRLPETVPAQYQELPPAEHLQSVRAQFQLDGGRDRDGLLRGTVGVALDTNSSLGLESRFTYWLETLPDSTTDGTWIGDVNVRFGLVTLPALALRFGIGPRVQVDGSSKSGGFNSTLGAEVYPISPLVLRFDVDAGNLGKAFVFESQASLGVLLWRTELLAGVSTLHVGDVAFDSAFAGVRFHL